MLENHMVIGDNEETDSQECQHCNGTGRDPVEDEECYVCDGKKEVTKPGRHWHKIILKKRQRSSKK